MFCHIAEFHDWPRNPPIACRYSVLAVQANSVPAPRLAPGRFHGKAIRGLLSTCQDGPSSRHHRFAFDVRHRPPSAQPQSLRRGLGVLDSLCGAEEILDDAGEGGGRTLGRGEIERVEHELERHRAVRRDRRLPVVVSQDQARASARGSHAPDGRHALKPRAPSQGR